MVRHLAVVLFAASVAMPVGAVEWQESSSSSSAAAARESARQARIMEGRKTLQNDYNSKVLLKGGGRQSGASQFALAAKVGTCVAAKGKAEANRLVGGPMTADPNYNALVKALQSRKYDRCVDQNAVGVPMNLINGALAEALVRQGQGSMDDRAKGPDAKAIAAFSASPSGRTLESVSRCLAGYSPGLGYKVLSSEPGSAAETAALAALYRQSPECGLTAVPNDFTADEQRAAIASGLYFWTHRG